MTERDEPPRFFLDRGIGSVFVPEGLRENDWQVTTMDERYGADASQDVADIDWIREATELGESLITKDTAIARVPVEAQVVHMCDARVFTITSARITGPQCSNGFCATSRRCFVGQAARRHHSYSASTRTAPLGSR